MRTLLIALSLASALSAQPIQFDVASIRESAQNPGTEGSGRELVEVTASSVWIRNASLSFLVQWAYGVEFYQVSGPEWLKDRRYDVQAKPPSPATIKDLRLMLRALLDDRFKLASHMEQRPRPVYALVIRNGNLKLQTVPTDRPSAFRVMDGDFVFSATTMTEFAERLSDFATVDRPVVDRTSLTGRFDFKLDSAARAIRGGEGPSIFTAVSELGLQLRPTNEPVETIVIDSAETQPSAN